jgi:molybdopterin-guanine dinucleotide biosynthesis protein A
MDKAFLPLDGQPMVARAVGKLSTLSDDLVVVTNAPERYQRLGLPVRLVPDLQPGAGSLMGVYSGLRVVRHSHALLVACDMPFLNLALLEYMLSLISDHDVIIPRVGELLEPLHAIYSRACLPHMARLLDTGQRKISACLSEVRVRYVEEDEIRGFDPQHLSFMNVNTPADWKLVQELLGAPGAEAVS